MPTIDLHVHVTTLGDPSAYFIHPTPNRTLVVEHATGRPRFTVQPDGSLVEYVPDPIKGSLTVVNPPGFTGFPEHDKSDPAFDPATHGLADSHFTHWATDKPVLVRHATGIPEFVIVGGKAVPIL